MLTHTAVITFVRAVTIRGPAIRYFGRTFHVREYGNNTCSTYYTSTFKSYNVTVIVITLECFTRSQHRSLRAETCSSQETMELGEAEAAEAPPGSITTAAPRDSFHPDSSELNFDDPKRSTKFLEKKTPLSRSLYGVLCDQMPGCYVCTQPLF